LDTKIAGADSDSGCREVSAGHPKHEWTSGCCVDSVFKFLASKVTDDRAETSKEEKKEEKIIGADSKGGDMEM